MLRGRMTGLEAELFAAERRLDAQASLIDALETEVSRPMDAAIQTRLDEVRAAIEGANTSAVEVARDLVRTGKITPNQARLFVGLDISDKSGATSLVISDGEAKPTKLISLDPTMPKGRGPKGGAK
jgi:hypothetical protein